MATYSDKSFNTKQYNLARPNYPLQFYHTLLSYHTANPSNGTSLALDIGCGSGFATKTLTQFFDKVIGTDISPQMIQEAQNSLSDEDNHQCIEFIIAASEKAPEVIDHNSIDLITAAECAHWFNHSKFFIECHRILRPGATLAYWFYKDPKFVDYEAANKIYDKYCYDDERYMGPKWEQPGRNFLRTMMKEVEPPKKLYKDIVRNDFIVGEDNDEKSSLIIKRVITLRDLREYVRSWSAYHSWMKAHAGENIDVADMFIQELKEVMGWDDVFKFEVRWDTTYTFARKI